MAAPLACTRAPSECSNERSRASVQRGSHDALEWPRTPRLAAVARHSSGAVPLPRVRSRCLGRKLGVALELPSCRRPGRASLMERLGTPTEQLRNDSRRRIHVLNCSYAVHGTIGTFFSINRKENIGNGEFRSEGVPFVPFVPGNPCAATRTRPHARRGTAGACGRVCRWVQG